MEGVGQEHEIAVDVSVDETRGHDFVGGIDADAGLSPSQPPECRDVIAADTHVAAIPRVAAAVHDPAAGDENIEHDVTPDQLSLVCGQDNLTYEG